MITVIYTKEGDLIFKKNKKILETVVGKFKLLPVSENEYKSRGIPSTVGYKIKNIHPGGPSQHLWFFGDKTAPLSDEYMKNVIKEAIKLMRKKKLKALGL